MTPRKYLAASARDALRRIKEELGPDAIVLSNRPVEGGVEILALPANALDSMTAPAPKPVAQPVARPAVRAAAPVALADAAEDDDFQVTLSGSMAARSAPPRRDAPIGEVRAPKPWQPYKPRPATPNELRDMAHSRDQSAANSQLDAHAEVVQRRAAPELEPPLQRASAHVAVADRPSELESNLREELGSIRRMLEQQLAGFAWGEMSRGSPLKASLAAEMLESGFSATTTYRLLDLLTNSDSLAAARNELRTLIGRDLITLNSDADIIDRGGVYALVGPTGVGKTTTTAKLAARCVVRHGADKVALLTTDGYRIGAHEQLRIYGRILGVPVHAVRDASDLRRMLVELRDKHMVLIDTVGMSQRDQAVSEQIAMLSSSGDVRRLLLLNAVARADALDDVVRAYSAPNGGADLAGAIISKVDESVTLGPVLDVLMRHQLPLFYVANGQRVPEDLHLPNRAYLLHRALRPAGEESSQHLSPQDAGLVMAASRRNVRNEVSRG
ncbi:MAG: flagellar biosynthesis protein FlhF [Methyloversatilis sp.]|jgi:flagellar biosynthesis protein FlhF|nr:flagellar biosynthesis protein FlhF [Methyloversatilis sp.]MBP6194167.1 flagellar biosynthesis protein FlhF [Methyloversatilis sp.]MBP9117408.1 flagellar biosynthesis protein FlhF [Methyloversatilis sp.]